MMEEIDRFQVPPVNGETQPLVREDRQKNTSYANHSQLNAEDSTVYFACGFIVTAVTRNLRVRANG